MLSDDLLVCDTGSTDATVPAAIQNGAKVIEIEWNGYGPTKNEVNLEAKYNWILQLDADEVVDETLLNSLLSLKLDDEKEIFKVRFKNYIGKAQLRFGDWGKKEQLRLFNANYAMWSEAATSEKLVYDDSCHISILNGFILHKTKLNKERFEEKIMACAKQSAEKDFKNNKKGTWVKQHLSPFLCFLRNYFLKLGVLDGFAGFVVASLAAKSVKAKYSILNKMQKTQAKS